MNAAVADMTLICSRVLAMTAMCLGYEQDQRVRLIDEWSEKFNRPETNTPAIAFEMTLAMCLERLQKQPGRN